MKVTILGCGASSGVPTIGNNWGNCDPNNQKNARTRTSIFIEDAGTSILIDSSPDVRVQLIREKISNFDAILYTHEHADHTHGIDDLRLVSYLNGLKPIPTYGEKRCIDNIKKSFPYMFIGQNTTAATPANFVPFLEEQLIDPSTPFSIKNLNIIPFPQNHGVIDTIGFRIKNFAYSTDALTLNENAFQILEGIDVWVVDCLKYEKSHSHSHYEQTLSWIERVKPKKAYFIQMNKDLDYDTLCRDLPPHIRPAYDGLKIEV